jgi:hypothetical protein
LKELGRIIGDRKFLRLVSQLMNAGFFEVKEIFKFNNYGLFLDHSSFSILLNIVLYRLDLNIEKFNSVMEKKSLTLGHFKYEG